jgi:hypothetical protein
MPIRSKSTARSVGTTAETRPAMLARIHGSAWPGDGAAMLTALADALER